MTTYRKLPRLRAVLSAKDWEDLQRDYPDLAEALHIEVESGASARDVFEAVSDSEWRELADKMQRAAAYLIAQAERETA